MLIRSQNGLDTFGGVSNSDYTQNLGSCPLGGSPQGAAGPFKDGPIPT